MEIVGRGFMSRGRGNQRYIEKKSPQRFYFHAPGSVCDWISGSRHGSDVSEQDCKLVTSHTCLRLRRHLFSLKSQNLRSKKQKMFGDLIFTEE